MWRSTQHFTVSLIDLAWQILTKPFGNHSEGERDGRMVTLHCLLFTIVHSSYRRVDTYDEASFCWIAYECAFICCYILCRSPLFQYSKWFYILLISTCPYVTAICLIINDDAANAAPALKWIIFPIAIASYLLSNFGVIMMFLFHVVGSTLIYMLTILSSKLDLNFSYNITLGMFWICSNLAQRRLASESILAKQVFTSSVSHELRTPLNAVLASLELVLEDKSINESNRKFLKLAHDSGDLMLHLVSDLLDYSRASMGHLQLTFENVVLFKCVSQSADPYMLSTDAKRVLLQIIIDSDVPETIWSDDRRIRQNLGNLLSNAFKFTYTGFVQIRVSHPDKRHIKFEVDDTGSGIPYEKQKLLFRPFVRLDDSKPGTGLGLVNCQHIAKALGGQCGFTSTPGKGSCFWFTVMYALRSPPPRSKQRLTTVLPSPLVFAPPRQSLVVEMNRVLSSRLMTSDGAKQKVLLVEDNVFNQEVACEMLKRINYEFVLAKNGRECLELYWERPLEYAVILMDCQMPIMNGYEATRVIRSRELAEGQSRGVPIVAMTADASENNRQHCLALGMDIVLTKPVKRADLEALLIKICRTHS
eukprot:GILJ01006551.1.p1 GENE.GILJ01006551.1~~GILJ01006551.1.p1  ORF type:complete len:589 (+),score=52.10 GILJ01006551.1:81-1847(+)